jgi:hypothetical protein
MRRFAYLLILPLLAAQVDDALAAALVLPSAPLADEEDDDACLPSQRRPQEEEPHPGKRPAFVRLQPRTAAPPLARRGGQPESNLTTPFGPPPLYVFMSLQI